MYIIAFAKIFPPFTFQFTNNLLTHPPPYHPTANSFFN